MNRNRVFRPARGKMEEHAHVRYSTSGFTLASSNLILPASFNYLGVVLLSSLLGFLLPTSVPDLVHTIMRTSLGFSFLFCMIIP
jgi:hypothetical protein